MCGGGVDALRCEDVNELRWGINELGCDINDLWRVEAGLGLEKHFV